MASRKTRKKQGPLGLPEMSTVAGMALGWEVQVPLVLGRPHTPP